MSGLQGTVRPVRLELNRRGSWMTVAAFDAGQEDDAEAVIASAQVIAHISGGKWRVCTDESLPCVLMRLDNPKLGWQVASGADA